jgi:hypothetical protein
VSKLTDKSKGKTCIRCGSPDAYSAHFNGTYQHQYGKGRGIKCHDLATAEFCYVCDQLFSEGTTSGFHNQGDRDSQFLHYIVLTNIRRFNDGVLKVA